MMAIGDTLREARMRQRVDISEVEDETKIRAKYLRAIENEEFDLLPGETFVRSFIRTYAEYLGLDSHLLVEQYRAQHEPHVEAELQPFPPQPRSRERRYGGPPGPGAVVAAALIALLALLLILGLTGDEDDGRPAPEGTTEATTAQEAPPARPRRPRPRPRPAARGISLQIIPVEETYVCIDDGRGNTVFEGVLTAPQTFRGRRLRLNLGKTSAAVRVNGRPVAIAQSPDPVGLDFTPRGQRPLRDAERPCA